MTTVTLYTLTIDSDDGTFTTVSADESELDARAAAIVADEWGEDDGPMPADWREAYAVLQEGSWDTYLCLNSHDVALPGIATEGPEERLAPQWNTQVSLIFGASAYAVITECGVRFDVRLSPGRLAATSLREYATEQRARADCIIENAERAERAAVVLDQRNADKQAGKVSP